MAGLSDIIDFVRSKFSPRKTETEVVQERDYTPEIASATEMGPIPEETTVEDVSAYRKHLLDKEGFKTEAYKPTKKEDEPWTIGVGHTGPEVIEGMVITDDKAYEYLDEDILKRLPALRARFENFDDLPESVRVPMLGSWFRGGLGAWGDTQELIAKGDFLGAAEEVLNNREYDLAKTEEGKDKDMGGLVSRFEEFSDALRRHGEKVQGKATGGMVMRNPYNNYNKQRAI